MQKISNNDAWSNIFEDLKILDKINKNRYFDISSNEIKKRDGKEARLMTKIDHKEHLPKVMKDNSLSILAISNGIYRIAKTNPFIDIKPNPQCDIVKIEPPKNLISLDPLNLRSESASLDIAKISKMLDIVFQEETELTIRGRLRGDLIFNLDNISYDIKGVQVEVDGGYEGKNTLNLIEAKIGYRNNINIRQILYPELYWKNQLQNKKAVKSFLFYYQDGIFRFIPFEYDGNIISSIPEKEKAFAFIKQTTFNLSNIEKEKTIYVNRAVPFPQADDFEKIHSIFLSIGNSNSIEKDMLFYNFDIVERQYDYYLNVLKWMNLCEQKDTNIVLTKKGLHFLSLNIDKRMEEFAKIVFSEPICYNLLRNLPVDYKDFQQYKISGSTIERRLQSIKSWIKYFNKFFENN